MLHSILSYNISLIRNNFCVFSIQCKQKNIETNYIHAMFDTFFTTAEYVNEEDFYKSVREYIVSIKFFIPYR